MVQNVREALRLDPKRSYDTSVYFWRHGDVVRERSDRHCERISAEARDGEIIAVPRVAFHSPAL